jgi:hypothetical protein
VESGVYVVASATNVRLSDVVSVLLLALVDGGRGRLRSTRTSPGGQRCVVFRADERLG